MLTKEEEFLINTADNIKDPEAKQAYLDRLQASMKITSKTSNPYNLKDILNRNKKPSSRPININDLQTEIKQQKIEI